MSNAQIPSQKKPQQQSQAATLCNYCNDKNGRFFLDCHCVFCQECFEQRISIFFIKNIDPIWKKQIPQLQKQQKQNIIRGKCQFCEKMTCFKKLDTCNEKDRPAISNQIMNTNVCLGQQLDSLKFQNAQHNKKIAFLDKKANFFQNCFESLMRNKKITLNDQPLDLVKQGQQYFKHKSKSVEVNRGQKQQQIQKVSNDNQGILTLQGSGQNQSLQQQKAPSHSGEPFGNQNRNQNFNVRQKAGGNGIANTANPNLENTIRNNTSNNNTGQNYPNQNLAVTPKYNRNNQDQSPITHRQNIANNTDRQSISELPNNINLQKTSNPNNTNNIKTIRNTSRSNQSIMQNFKIHGLKKRSADNNFSSGIF